MEWQEEFDWIERLLDSEFLPVDVLCSILSVTPSRIIRGRVLGLQYRKQLMRTGVEDWKPFDLGRVSDYAVFYAWLEKNRPKTQMKLDAVLVDRAYRRGLR